MFGLLNPALTPIKAKITLICAGLVVAALAVAWLIVWFLFGRLESTQSKLGAVNVALADSIKTSNDNELLWSQERAGYLQALDQQREMAARADKAVAEARAREAKYDRALKIALNTLKETAHEDPEAAEWSVVRLPDAVVDGMCRAASATTNEAQACGDDPVRARPDSGEPARPVPDQPTT